MTTPSPKVRKNLRLSQAKLDRARRILGTATETETVEQALDLVAFREEVLAGVRQLAGSGSLRDVLRDGEVVTKYVLDSNLFVQATRDRGWAEQLMAFYAAFLPVTYLHAVVVQELLLGAISAQRRSAVYDAYVTPFERRQRVIVPGYRAWRRSGEVVGTLVQRRRLSPGGFTRSFLNDVLLAVSCHQLGFTVVTTNERDFALIASVERVAFVPPWPTVP